MGNISVTIEVANVHGETFEEVVATVDTARDFTTLPRGLLERLGVPVTGTVVTEMAGGQLVSCDTGWARIRLEGDEEYTRVIFGGEEEAIQLGRITLETARLAVDLHNKQLVRVKVRRY